MGEANHQLQVARARIASPSFPGQSLSRLELAELVIAYLREHKGRHVMVDDHYVGKLERGVIRWPHADYREALRVILRAESDGALGLRRPRRAARDHAPDIPSTALLPPGTTPPDVLGLASVDSQRLTSAHRPSVSVSVLGEAALFDSHRTREVSETACVVRQVTKEDFAVDRREAGLGVVALVFGAPLLEPVEFWLLDQSQSAGESHSDGGRSRRRSPVGDQEIDEIERAAQLFRSWDDKFGGGLRRKAVVGQLDEVAELLGKYWHPADLKSRLFGVMAKLAETVATMSWDSGKGTLAQHYYLLALRSAREAGDRLFAANVVAGMARQLLYAGHTSDALELVRLAQEGLRGQTGTTVNSMLYTREAWCYAKQGRIGAFRRATANAEDAFAHRDGTAGDPYWITYFDEAELAGVTGGRLLELARVRHEIAPDAAAHIERAVESRDPQRFRSSALDRIGLAEARLVEREYVEAARLGHAAVDVAAQTQSSRVRVKLQRLYRTIGGTNPEPAVVELRDRLGRHLASESDNARTRRTEET